MKWSLNHAGPGHRQMLLPFLEHRANAISGNKIQIHFKYINSPNHITIIPMSTTISNLHLSSDEGNQFAFVRGESEETCTNTIMTQSEYSPDILSSPSKPLQYRIRRGCPKLVTRASNCCVHGITRSVCKICDPVGYKISRI